MKKEKLDFLIQFLKNPKGIGALFPSSTHLATKIVGLAGLDRKRAVVELGTGIGVFTEKIVNNLTSDSIFFGLEINPEFVEKTRKIVDGVEIHQASALDLGKYLEVHDQDYVDCIVSGLPWANFSDEWQKELLDVIFHSLSEDGIFLTFAYSFGSFLPRGKNFKNLLIDRFAKVKKSNIVWRNFPPAFVYVAKK